jgi:hypothetical protein
MMTNKPLWMMAIALLLIPWVLSFGIESHVWAFVARVAIYGLIGYCIAGLRGK